MAPMVCALTLPYSVVISLPRSPSSFSSARRSFRSRRARPSLSAMLEGDVERAFLRIREAHEARQQQRPHLGDGGADGVALLAEQIPEDGGRGFEAIVVEADGLGALDEEVLWLALHADAGEVALHVRCEDGDAHPAEAFRHDLEGHRLAGAGGAGDQAVAVRHGQEEFLAASRSCPGKLRCRTRFVLPEYAAWTPSNLVYFAKTIKC